MRRETEMTENVHYTLIKRKRIRKESWGKLAFLSHQIHQMWNFQIVMLQHLTKIEANNM